MPRILFSNGIIPHANVRFGVSEDELYRVLYAWDQNGFRDEDEQRCYACNALVMAGEYQVCVEGCGTAFCDACAKKHFVGNKCCVRSTSPTYIFGHADHRQKSILNFLEGPVRKQPSRKAKRLRVK